MASRHFIVIAFGTLALVAARRSVGLGLATVLLAFMPVFFLSTGLRTTWEMGGLAAFGAAALLAGAAALDSVELLLELQPASASADTAMTAAANLMLVFNVSPWWVTGRRHGAFTWSHPNHSIRAGTPRQRGSIRSLQGVHIRCDPAHSPRHGRAPIWPSRRVTKRSRSMSSPTAALGGRPVTAHRSATVRPMHSGD